MATFTSEIAYVPRGQVAHAAYMWLYVIILMGEMTHARSTEGAAAALTTCQRAVYMFAWRAYMSSCVACRCCIR